jgi:hypothetical protein
MGRPLSPSALRPFLGVLAALASLAALGSLVWPRWPSVRPLDGASIAGQLRAGGFEAVPLTPLPARRSSERTTSPGLSYGIGAGETLRVLRGRSRERRSGQAAQRANPHPALKLQQRQLLTGPPPSALGQVAGSPVRQTCLVIGEGSSGGFGVVDEQLWNLVDQADVGRNHQLKALLGLRPSRSYECVLISVSGPKGGQPISEERWQRLLTTIRPALRRGATMG